jgi:GMP synthase-like glutamine amidotransferase
MKVGILECGVPPEAVAAPHGSYADAVRRMIGPAHDTQIFPALHGVLPDSATGCDAYVVTGSPAGVMDDLPWIPPLLDFLRAARGRARLVGLCFGHQAMAAAFGGRVEKSRRGWGLGLHAYDVVARAPWMDAAATIRAPAFHQDQVVAAPADARLLLTSGFTPVAGLDYGDAVSFQFHPEFTVPYAVALTEALRDRFGERTAPALASYAAPDDVARVQGWIGRFLGAPLTRSPAAAPS